MRKATGIVNNGLGIVAAATNYIIWTNPGRRVVIRKIMFHNRTGGRGVLRVGFLTNAVVPVFTQVLPDITMINGISDSLEEQEIPQGGNYPEGFFPNTTPNTGTLGDIVVQSDVGAAGAFSVEVAMEVEEEPDAGA